MPEDKVMTTLKRAKQLLSLRDIWERTGLSRYELINYVNNPANKVGKIDFFELGQYFNSKGFGGSIQGYGPFYDGRLSVQYYFLEGRGKELRDAKVKSLVSSKLARKEESLGKEEQKLFGERRDPYIDEITDLLPDAKGSRKLRRYLMKQLDDRMQESIESVEKKIEQVSIVRKKLDDFVSSIKS